MHELSLAQSMLTLVEQSARHGGFRKVAAIRLEIGRLACVMPEALRFCFESVTRGSLAEGARLDIIEIAGAGRCPGCEATRPLDELYGICPDCGIPLEVTAGTEMRLKELDVT